MIVDVHSHAWQYPLHFNDDFRRQACRASAGVEVDLTVRFEDYLASTQPGAKAIVFGGKAKLSGLWVDDQYVARYVNAHPETLIGFLSVDPTQEGWGGGDGARAPGPRPARDQAAVDVRRVPPR